MAIVSVVTAFPPSDFGTLGDGTGDRHEVDPSATDAIELMFQPKGLLASCSATVNASGIDWYSVKFWMSLSFCDRTNILMDSPTRKSAFGLSERSDPSQQNLRIWEWLRDRSYRHSDHLVAVRYFRRIPAWAFSRAVSVIPSAVDAPPVFQIEHWHPKIA